MYLYETDRGGCYCLHHMGAAPHSTWSNVNPAAFAPLAPPFFSHHSQWASQCFPASLYLSNPLRLDPTPPTAPTQSDNPIRTHGQLTSRDAESMFACRLEIRNVRAHKWDKNIHSQYVLKCKSMPESGTAHTRAHLMLHLAQSIMVLVYWSTKLVLSQRLFVQRWKITQCTLTRHVGCVSNNIIQNAKSWAKGTDDSHIKNT